MEFCESDNGNGCGHHFPKKSSSSLYAKCNKLTSLSEGSADYELWKAYCQCESCSIAWKNLTTAKCGCCIAVDTPQPHGGQLASAEVDAQNVTHIALETSRAARANVMEACLMKQPAVLQALHTTAGLSAAKSNMVTGDNKVFIEAQCCIKTALLCDQKHTDPGCGQWGKPWPKDAYMSEVLEDYLATLNVRWCADHGMALINEEVEFQWMGNKLFLPGDANLQVGEVYNRYMTGKMAHYYSGPSSRTKRAAGSQLPFSMAVKLYVDKVKFTQCHKALTQAAAVTAVRKRSAMATEIDGTPLQKHLMGVPTGGRMQSMFVQTSCTNNTQVDASTIVQLKRAHMTCDAETREVEIEWPKNAPLCEGVIGNEVFASGATKNVYKLSLDSELYVVKRFFEIGSGKEVTADKNKANLESELIHLKNAEWFLAKFKSQVKDNGIEYSSNIIIADAFLVCEIGQPSPASTLPSFEEDAAIWLVEPCCTKAVWKFSGTLIHPSHTDKLGMTLSAYAHFLYECSGQELVLANIQGSHMTIQGIDTLILFDPMDSGIGDHGLEGINSFTSQHTCNYICQGLKLDPLTDNEASSPEAGEVEE
ncbi:kinase-like domain-containing protein [Gymnopilus junonius]|uniref:Kinase-like domain-containing protein n=1 Tax=Gymnopilus junonius TaxID=109634 RepID=A0A9P5NX64_GYMJU|nr:kinase-like domain-containing protein [Gymnopilus junonius]